MDPITAGLIIGAGASLWSGIAGAKAAAKEADRRREAEMDAAKMQYAATEHSVNLMKAANQEALNNYYEDVLRASAAQTREVKQEIQKAGSTLQAQSEGVTSGRSKGREMISLAVKGAEAMQESKQQGADLISQAALEKDRQQNELNNKLFSAHQEMASVLSTPGQIYRQNRAQLIGNTISAGAQGAALGARL
jgi:predicted ATP-binding protein involved in virulence